MKKEKKKKKIITTTTSSEPQSQQQNPPPQEILFIYYILYIHIYIYICIFNPERKIATANVQNSNNLKSANPHQKTRRENAQKIFKIFGVCTVKMSNHF